MIRARLGAIGTHSSPPFVIPDLIRDPATYPARQEEAGPRIKSGATDEGLFGSKYDGAPPIRLRLRHCERSEAIQCRTTTL
ncbi:conserved hypothetical protein [Sphingomonas sp. 8AM]|nr:conserved hypothetical protein [Sphingomonas sp. 8AM]